MEREIINTDVVTLDALKKHLRLLEDEFDTMLSVYLSAAITAAENYTNIIIYKSKLTITLPWSYEIKLPVSSVTSVDEIECDGEIVSTDCYSYRDNTINFTEQLSGDVTISMYAGGDIPDDIRVAILLHASKLFTTPVDSVETLPTVSKNLLNPYKNWNI